jgi:hypothetical protein
MKRQGWEKILCNYIERNARIPFSWGVNDCVTFVSDYIEKVTGRKPNSLVDGTYESQEQAIEVLANLQTTPIEIMDNLFSRISFSFAQRGDVVYRERETGFSFGIIDSGRAIYKVDGVGYKYEKIKEADIVWRIE